MSLIGYKLLRVQCSMWSLTNWYALKTKEERAKTWTSRWTYSIWTRWRGRRSRIHYHQTAIAHKLKMKEAMPALLEPSATRTPRSSSRFRRIAWVIASKRAASATQTLPRTFCLHRMRSQLLKKRKKRKQLRDKIFAGSTVCITIKYTWPSRWSLELDTSWFWHSV